MASKKISPYSSRKKEEIIINMVRKYPLFSVDKLAAELPDVSRNSIQRILEKRNLSTAEKRLNFSSEETGLPSGELKRRRLNINRPVRNLKKFSLFSWVEKLKFVFPKFSVSPKRASFLVGVSLTGLILIWQVSNYLFAKPPEIILEQPSVNYSQEGENLFVVGKINITRSKVIVNDQPVSLNGDGTFTAVVQIPLGESVVEIKARNYHKESKLLRLVRRLPTNEELRAQEEMEAERKLLAANKAAGIERRVEDLLAAKSAAVDQGQEGFLRISNNQIEEEEGFASVSGEVVNMGDQAVTWVMVTANFYNKSGEKVDSKIGFATDFEEYLKPGERAEFLTQPTQKEFDSYKLELSWEEKSTIKEESSVAGVSTSSADFGLNEEATESSNKNKSI